MSCINLWYNIKGYSVITPRYKFFTLDKRKNMRMVGKKIMRVLCPMQMIYARTQGFKQKKRIEFYRKATTTNVNMHII